MTAPQSIKHNRLKGPSMHLFAKRDQAYNSVSALFEEFIEHAPELDAVPAAIRQKAEQFDIHARQLVCEVVKSQLDEFNVDIPAVHQSVDLLANAQTFAIITAHQPCLFTGPLYVIYKIASAIALANNLSKHYPAYNFVPIYVIGGEDHDFEEINHFHLFDKKIEWHTNQGGAVGRMVLEGIDDVHEQINDRLGNDAYGQKLLQKLREAYHADQTLAAATAKFIYSLFGHHGLVALHMDDKRFKRKALDLFNAELQERIAKPLVINNHDSLVSMGYGSQIYPRDINLFYLSEDSRERIVPAGHDFEIGGEKISAAELRDRVELDPTLISPNVVLRPLYQQLILPGVVYIGGGSEVSYWMEVRGVFQHFNLAFPMLIRRDSATWISPHIAGLIEKVNFESNDLFTSEHQAQEHYLKTHQGEDWTLDHIREQFDSVYTPFFEEIESIDRGLLNSAMGFQKQHHAFLEKMESKLRKSIKSQHEVSMKRIAKIWKSLYPNGKLQERHQNFLPIYSRLGSQFIDAMINHFDPLEFGMHVFTETK